jgi:hypothetical protein
MIANAPGSYVGELAQQLLDLEAAIAQAQATAAQANAEIGRLHEYVAVVSAAYEEAMNRQGG